MQKTLIVSLSIMVSGMVIVFFIHSIYNRHSIVTLENGKTYQIDRKNGNTWLIDGKNKISMDEEKPAQPIVRHVEVELPAEAIAKVSVNGHLKKGVFIGKAYNGSDHSIAKLVLKLTAKDNTGRVRWTRTFAEGLLIKPLTTERFSFSVTDDEGIVDVDYQVATAFSIK